MRTLLMLLGVCGLLLMSVPDIVPGTLAKAKRVNIPQAKGQQMKVRQVGLASWYGKPHHGRPTASGERFSRRLLTAAHRSLPLGTKVRVTNLRTKKHVIVKINDRGPYADKKRRIIDLSEAAAARLGMREQGVEQVEIVVVGDAS